MNRSIRKANTVRTHLLNKFRKENQFLNKVAYKRQRIFLLNLLTY